MCVCVCVCVCTHTHTHTWTENASLMRAGSPVIKGAEKKSQLHARSDLELIRSLPGSAGLINDLEVREDGV